MRKFTTRTLSVLLAVLMLFTMIPFTSVAAEDTATDTTPEETAISPVVFKGTELLLASNSIAASVSTNEASGVATIETTQSVTDKDNVHYYVRFPETVNMKDTPYIVLGAANQDYTGKVDISIGGTNGYITSTSTEYASFRLYGKTFGFTDTISNIYIDTTAYTGGDKSAGYSGIVTDDSTFDYLRIRYRGDGQTIPVGTQVDIRFVAFFATPEEAQSYVHPVETAPVTYMFDGVQFGDVQTYNLGDRLKYPDAIPESTEMIRYNGWDVAQGTMVDSDLTVNANLAKAVRVYNASDITVTESQYPAEKYITEPISYVRLTNGSITAAKDNTRFTVNIVNNDIVMGNARYVKMRYRTNGEQTVYLAPMVNGKRLFDSGVTMTRNGQWNEFLFDIGYKNYTGGDGDPGAAVKNLSSAEEDWEYLKDQYFTGFLLRAFGNNGTTCSANLTFDISGIAFFATKEEAEAWSFPVEETTVTYYNGEEVFTTQTYNIGDALVYPETAPTKENAEFASWNVANGIDVTADLVVNAQYNFELSLSASEGGKVSVNGSEAAATASAMILENTEATITATDDEFYNFVGWYNGEELVSDSHEYVLTVTEKTSLTAKFTDAPYAIFKVNDEVFANIELDEATNGLVYPAEIPQIPGYGFSSWSIEEGTVVEDQTEVTAELKAPKAMFDISNFSSYKGGTYITLRPMTDTQSGNDYYHVYETVGSAIASHDASRVYMGTTGTDQTYDISVDKYAAFGYRTNIAQNQGKVGLNMEINGTRLWGAYHASVADGQWHNSVINFDSFTGGECGTAAAPSYRHGMMNVMHYRPHGQNAGFQVRNGDYYDILYMAIFDDQVAAKNYVYPGNTIEKDEYTVTFYDEDKTTVLESHSIKSGYGVYAPEYTPGENEYFVNWVDKEANTINFTDPSVPLVITSNREFYPEVAKDVIAAGTYTNYITDRADLANVFNKLTVDKSLTVAYFGGSVTAGAGASASDSTSWRGLTYNTLVSSYPDATVTMVNAAIGGSGSRAGSFRVDTDIIAQNPDLVFVEFVVNDDYCGENSASAAKYYETVIRKIRTALSNAEIISIFTTNSGHANSTGAETMNAKAAVHDAVAAHYGITSIDVGRALVEAMGGYDEIAWKSYFTDSVHPSDNGYKVYADVISQYIADELAALAALETVESVTYEVPETYYSDDASIFTTDVIEVTDTTAVSYNEGFTLTSDATVFATTEIPGYIAPTADGATVTVNFKGTELNVFMEFAGGGSVINYQIDDDAVQTKTLNDTNHPLKLVSNLIDKEHTVVITFPTANSSVKIGAFFVGGVNVGDITVEYVDGEEVVATQTYAYGETLVYPDYEIAPSETEGNFRKWDIPEGIAVRESLTVSIIDGPATPVAVATGRDLRFKFSSRNFPGIFYNTPGFIEYAEGYTANDDSYTATVYNMDAFFNFETGVYNFKEGVSGNYGPGVTNYVEPILNFPTTAKYLKLGISVNCEVPGPFVGDLIVYTNTGSVNVPVDLSTTSEGITDLILDISTLPAGSTNIRSIRIFPWMTTGKNIKSGSTCDIAYVYGFTSAEEAEAYAHSYTAPEKYSVTVSPGEYGTVKLNRAEITEYTAEHYASDIIYLEVTPDLGYEFKGWYIGEERAVPSYTSWKWGDAASNKTLTITGEAYTVENELTLTAVYEPILHTVTFVANGETVSEQTVQYGSLLGYPEYDIPVSDKEGYVNLWDVEEGTAVTSDITVTLIEKEIAPVAVASGRDMKFTFATDSFPNIFYRIPGLVKSTETFEANEDSYSSTVYDSNQMFDAETGIWSFMENIHSWYAPSANNNITPIINFPTTAKYISLGISVKAIGANAFVGDLVVTTDAGTIDVPVDFTSISDGIANVVLDVRAIPESAKNIRSITIWPWEKTNADTTVRIKNGSGISIEYIAGFETLVEANAYEHSYTAPAKHLVELTAQAGGSFSLPYGSAITEYSAEYYNGDVIYLTATADENYAFDGWYDGDTKVTGDYATSWMYRTSDNKTGNATGDAFTVNGDIALTAKFVRTHYPITVTAVGNETLNGTVSVGGSEAAASYTGNAAIGELTLVASAPAGLRFEGWYNVINGANIPLGRSEELVITITEATEIEARFIDETISVAMKLSASVGTGGGTISIGGNAEEDFNDYVSSGTATTITATPDSGNKVAFWERVTSGSGTRVFMTTGESIDAYPLGSEVSYRPVFVEAAAEVRLYIDYANKVVDMLTDDSDAPKVPERLGYVANGWTEQSSTNGVTVYKASYTKPETGSYALTIKYANGETSEMTTLNYNDEIVLESSLENVAWTITSIDSTVLDEPIVMSYKESYTFNYSFTKTLVIEELEATSEGAVINTV